MQELIKSLGIFAIVLVVGALHGRLGGPRAALVMVLTVAGVFVVARLLSGPRGAGSEER